MGDGSTVDQSINVGDGSTVVGDGSTLVINNQTEDDKGIRRPYLKQ